MSANTCLDLVQGRPSQTGPPAQIQQPSSTPVPKLIKPDTNTVIKVEGQESRLALGMNVEGLAP